MPEKRRQGGRIAPAARSTRWLLTQAQAKLRAFVPQAPPPDPLLAWHQAFDANAIIPMVFEADLPLSLFARFTRRYLTDDVVHEILFARLGQTMQRRLIARVHVPHTGARVTDNLTWYPGVKHTYAVTLIGQSSAAYTNVTGFLQNAHQLAHGDSRPVAVAGQPPHLRRNPSVVFDAADPKNNLVVAAWRDFDASRKP